MGFVGMEVKNAHLHVLNLNLRGPSGSGYASAKISGSQTLERK